MAKKIINGLPQTIKITVNGQVVNYKSHAEAARAHNIKPGTFSLRLKKGWTLRQALGLSAPPKNANVHKVIYIDDQDIKFSSISEAARKYGIKESVVYLRLHHGWTAKEALGIESRAKIKPKGRIIEISVNGQKVVFDSISDAAKHFRLKPQLVLQRIATYGWTPEQALGIAEPPKDAGVPRPIQLKKGKTTINYKSIKEAVDAYGLSYDVVKQRMNKLGWTPEQAFELETPPKHEKGCLGYIYKITNTKNNKIYIGQTKATVDVRFKQHIETALLTKKHKKGSLHGAIKEFGVDNFTCEVVESADSIDKLNRLERRYISKMQSLDAAYGYNLSVGGSGLTGGNKVVVLGVKYDSLASAARAFNIKPKIAHQRMKTYGWTVAQALGVNPPPDGSSGPKIITVNEVGAKRRFESYIAAAHHYGVPYKIFHSRLRQGWSAEEALELKKRPRRINKGTEISVYHNGKHLNFTSITLAANAFRLKPSTVIARIARGWAPEKALGIE